jgi:hypothetical protein
VLAVNHKALKLSQDSGAQYHAHIFGMNPEKGRHRNVGDYLWPFKARAFGLNSENSVLVALDGVLMRVDLESASIRWSLPVTSSVGHQESCECPQARSS